MKAEFVIPLRAQNSLNARLHHMARWKRNQTEKRMVKFGWLTDVPPIQRTALKAAADSGRPITVLLTRGAPGSLDDDNLRGALKTVRDAIAKGILKRDDGKKAGIKWDYGEERTGFVTNVVAGKKIRRGIYWVRITITTEAAYDGIYPSGVSDSPAERQGHREGEGHRSGVR